jgi:hypothetical protein
MFRQIVLGVGLCFVQLIGPASVRAAAPETLDEYKAVFETGSSADQTRACQSLAYRGLSDPSLFDLIEARLLGGLQVEEPRDAVQAVAWLAKALSYSGQEKYVATLERASKEAKGRAIRNHATTAIGELPKHQRWNAIITDRSQWDASLSDADNRSANMLRSEDALLRVIAAKRAYYERLDAPPLLALLEAELRKASSAELDERRALDAAIWSARALARSKQPKYEPLLRDVATNAVNKKLRRNVEKALASTEPIPTESAESTE